MGTEGRECWGLMVPYSNLYKGMAGSEGGNVAAQRVSFGVGKGWDEDALTSEAEWTRR